MSLHMSKYHIVGNHMSRLIYGFMETGYGYDGKESRIGSCICLILWRRDMDTVGKKAELDPVHLLYFRDRIWI